MHFQKTKNKAMEHQTLLPAASAAAAASTDPQCDLELRHNRLSGASAPGRASDTDNISEAKRMSLAHITPFGTGSIDSASQEPTENIIAELPVFEFFNVRWRTWMRGVCVSLFPLHI